MAWYKLELRPDGDSWLVTSPDFPELTTFGMNTEEACRNGSDALEEAIAGRIADNEDIPHPLLETTGKGHFVEVPLLVYMKSALYMILRAQGKTRADLVRALGTHREQVDRLFRLDHNSTIESLEAAFKALDVPLRLNIEFPHAA